MHMKSKSEMVGRPAHKYWGSYETESAYHHAQMCSSYAKEMLVQQYGPVCQITGVVVDDWSELEVDHIIPLFSVGNYIVAEETWGGTKYVAYLPDGRRWNAPSNLRLILKAEHKKKSVGEAIAANKRHWNDGDTATHRRRNSEATRKQMQCPKMKAERGAESKARWANPKWRADVSAKISKTCMEPRVHRQRKIKAFQRCVWAHWFRQNDPDRSIADIALTLGISPASVRGYFKDGVQTLAERAYGDMGSHFSKLSIVYSSCNVGGIRAGQESC